MEWPRAEPGERREGEGWTRQAEAAEEAVFPPPPAAAAVAVAPLTEPTSRVSEAPAG